MPLPGVRRILVLDGRRTVKLWTYTPKVTAR